MPIYEYECSSCGHKKEVLQKLSDAPLKDCPACGKATLNKLISAAGFQLRGSGWYATDFKGGSKAGKAKDDGSSKVDGKAAEEGKSSGENKAKGDTKPKEEAKSDATASNVGASVTGH